MKKEDKITLLMLVCTIGMTIFTIFDVIKENNMSSAMGWGSSLIWQIVISLVYYKIKTENQNPQYTQALNKLGENTK